MGRDFDTAQPTTTLGYDRAAVDAFLSAASEERQKLEDEIKQSNLRLARARTALGTHRVMVAMLLETQRELSAMRRDAERQAAEIIAEAERDVRSGRGADLVAPTVEPPAGAIDLRQGATSPSTTTSVPSSAPSSSSNDALFAPAGQDDEFFEYLRGALSDDEPLGPRSDVDGVR